MLKASLLKVAGIGLSNLVKLFVDVVACFFKSDIMRESINYNMIPLPCDNMNVLINVGPRNFLTNISSNGYYGYQPRVHSQQKECMVSHNESQISKENNTVMEVQSCFQENRSMEVEYEMRQASRKRRYCYDERGEVKKRRQNDQHITTFNTGKNNLFKLFVKYLGIYYIPGIYFKF